MFGLHFGRYLLKASIISEKEYEVMSSYPYNQFVETLYEKKDTKEIGRYLQDFADAYGLDAQALELIEHGNDEKFIAALAGRNPFHEMAEMEASLLSDDELGMYKRFNRLVVNIIKYMYNQISKKIYINPKRIINDYDFDCLGYLEITGDDSYAVAISGKKANLLSVAVPFMGKKTNEMDSDACNAICEFLNCACGLFVSEMSFSEVDVELKVPEFFTNKKTRSKNKIYCIPLSIDEYEVDLLISPDTDITFS